jgi:hypothetical protein
MEIDTMDSSYLERWDRWTKVTIVQATPAFEFNWAWCKTNCAERFDAMSGIGRGRQTWIFESHGDAVMFKLAVASV